MAGERKTARELIEAGLRDTERCISQKQYNAAMIKARQTLEYIVKSLCRRNGVQEGDLSVMIDDLYLQGIISKDSCANYQKLRLLGENAISKADNHNTDGGCGMVFYKHAWPVTPSTEKWSASAYGDPIVDQVGSFFKAQVLQLILEDDTRIFI